MAFLFVVSGTTYTLPNVTTVDIEVIGGGGGGCRTDSTGGNSATGGGGGAYSKNAAVTVTANSVQNCQIGAGGAAQTTNNTAGNAGTDTWGRTDGGAASAPTTTAQGAMAKGGGGASPGGTAAGGASASGVGGTKNSGGAAPNANNAFGAGGGGGAGGPGGVGQAAGDVGPAGGGGGGNGGGGAGVTGSGLTGGNGGIAKDTTAGGTGGTGGASGNPGNAGSHGSGGGGGGTANVTNGNGGTGGNGGVGVDWDSTHGSGGGGGGGGADSGTGGQCGSGGTGGNYGGGGGGGAASNHNSGNGGAGGPGILVITYTAAAGGPVGEQLTDLVPSQRAPDQIQLRSWTWSRAILSPKVFPPGNQPGNPVYELTLQQKWPSAMPQVQSYGWTWSRAILTPQIFPAGKQFYDLPSGQRVPDQIQLRTWTWSGRPNLIIPIPPGEQLSDLSPSQRVADQIQLRTWTWSFNISLLPLPSGEQLYDRPALLPQDFQTWVQSTNLALLAPPVVQALPSGEQLYDLPVQPPAQVPQINWPNVALLTGPPPAAHQQDWPLPTQPFRLDQTWTGAFNLNLIVQVSLPSGEQVTDLPPQPALRSADLLTWIQSVNLALTTAPPDLTQLARQQDWPVPRGVEPDYRRSWEWGQNPNLVGVRPAGAANFDLPPRDFPRLLQTWIQSTNIALLFQPLPHNQYDWPLPGGHRVALAPLQIMVAGKGFWLVPPAPLPPGEAYYDRPQLRPDVSANLYTIATRPQNPTPVGPTGIIQRTLTGVGM